MWGNGNMLGGVGRLGVESLICLIVDLFNRLELGDYSAVLTLW